MSTVDLPALPASGASIVAGADASEIPGARSNWRRSAAASAGASCSTSTTYAFADGSVTAIRGVNGAGKSTFARITTGQQRRHRHLSSSMGRR
ncbi:hypothetical protein HCB39_27140 [Salinispora arenicola]|nr:hypothetical protein [Salinispora arenicola]